MSSQRHAPAAPNPRERPGTHCTGGWVGLRASLDRCGKSRPQPGPLFIDVITLITLHALNNLLPHRWPLISSKIEVYTELELC